ncbi:hypothetical protein K440107A6_18880 [Lawsonibacter asaccharolyticus]
MQTQSGYLRCVSTVKKEEIMTFKERFQARECSFNMIEDWLNSGIRGTSRWRFQPS